MNLDLTDAEAEALAPELAGLSMALVFHYPLVIRTLGTVLDKLQPATVCKPLPPREIYASPTRGYIQEGAVDVDIFPLLDDTEGGLESLTVSDPAHRDFSLW